MSDPTLGQRLFALKERSGLSLANIARSGGYKNASSIQRYFDLEYDAEFLPRPLAKRLKDALVGYGEPTIVDADIEELTEFGFELRRKSFHMPASAFQRRPTYTIDCNATFPSGQYVDEAETFSIADDPLIAFEKSEKLSSRAMNAIFVSTSSMSPRYDIGEVVFYEHERPAAIGADVLVILAQEDDGLPTGVLARLVAQSRHTVDLDILSPPTRLRLERSRVDVIYPLLRANDLLPDRNPRDHTHTS